jgi:hypothetical protein
VLGATSHLTRILRISLIIIRRISFGFSHQQLFSTHIRIVVVVIHTIKNNLTMLAKKVLFTVALAASVCVSASAFTQNSAAFATNTLLATKVRGGKGKAVVAKK